MGMAVAAPGKKRSTPETAIKAEDALDERDRSFDAGSKVPQPLVDPAALDPVGHRETKVFAEGHVLNTQRLSTPRDWPSWPSSESAVEACLPGRLAKRSQ